MALPPAGGCCAGRCFLRRFLRRSGWRCATAMTALRSWANITNSPNKVGEYTIVQLISLRLSEVKIFTSKSQ